MKHKKFLFLLFVMVLINGCAHKYSESPLATNFKTTKQHKLQSAYHWKVVSEDLAKSIIKATKSKENYYVVGTDNVKNTNQFDKAIHTLLRSSLVENGAKVSVKQTKNDLIVKLDIQVVKFARNNQDKKTAAAATMLTAGVWAIDGLTTMSDATAALGIGSAGAAILVDARNEYNSEYSDGLTPKYEVIIAVSVVKNNTYIAGFSNVYYIDNDDGLLYNKKKQERKAMIIKIQGK